MSIDLRTTYLGLPLRSPFVASASPCSRLVSDISRMEDAGAAAVVLYSLFEEQLHAEQFHWIQRSERGADSNPEALSYFPESEDFRFGPDAYLEHISKAREAVNIPIIASLNGCTLGGWTEFAKLIEAAGAHAIELNIYHLPTDPEIASEAIEDECVDIFLRVKYAVKIPVAVKLSPFYTNISRIASRLDAAGANGLVLFNRFYQPDIDPETLEVSTRILLSSSEATRLPQRWIAILYGRLSASLAATSGIHRATDAIKMLMAGADVTMLCAALLRRGLAYFEIIERETCSWMEKHDYESVAQLQGSMSQMNSPNPSDFERAQYVRAISTADHGLNFTL